MIRIVHGLLLAALPGALCSCSKVGGLFSKEMPVTAQVPEVPAQFRRGGAGSSEDITRVTIENPEDVTPARVEKIRARERDLVWTDPDNPESGLQGIEEAMSQNESRGPWRISFSEAKRASMREGKPLLVWFTDTQRSPLCRSLSAEVFSAQEFGSWADEELVRVRLDFNVKGETRGPGESAMDDRVRKVNYLESLKKRYKVLGLPTVLLLAPDGTVTGRYRGYKRTYGDFYFRRLKDDAEAARKHHSDWKESMGRRGYREWTDTRGRTVFAKLLRYSEGEMILVEPDGKRLQAKERNMSRVDQLWLENEKKKRKQ